jgi:hypothetical protein
VETAYLRTGVSAKVGRFELFGAGRYTAPHVEETVLSDSAHTERTRMEAVTLDAGSCVPFGERITLSTCASAKLGLTRTRHEARTGATYSAWSDEASPWLGAAVSALFAYRQSWLEPVAEVEAAVVALGRAEGASLLALRAGAGAAVSF